MIEPTFFIAALAGIISFFSPCVVPLIPGFMAYLAGTTVDESEEHRKDVFISSLLFVLGFGIVFSILGLLLTTVLEAIAFDVNLWVSRVAGVLIILFGLSLTGLVRIPIGKAGLASKYGQKIKSKKLKSFVFGMAFAAGWTSCASPVLGSVLALATTKPGTAFWLLFSYSLGLGAPFIITGLFTAQAQRFLRAHIRLIKSLNIFFGVFLILIGVLIFTQRLAQFAKLDYLINLSRI